MMKEPHILSAFDRDLEAVQAYVLRMGGLVEQALLDAAAPTVQTPPVKFG